MDAFADLDVWLRKAAELLTANRISVEGYRYTAPSLDTGDFGRKDYANQFLWDSCFHAIAWRWVDPQMAQDELRALVSRQVKDGPDTGMIPHCNYWRGGGTWLWNHDERSAITQPPLIGVAAWLVFERSGDTEFLSEIYAPLSAYHDWFDRRRDPDGDGLVSLIHPWESGGDALPRWDRSMGIDEFTHETGRTARHALAQVIVQFDTDAQALGEQGWYHIEPMDYNGFRAADMEAIGRIANALCEPDEAQAWQGRADAVRAAFQSKMIIDNRPYDLDGLEEKPIEQDSAGQLMTLFGGCPTSEQAELLIAQLQEPRFWTPFPVPTTPTDAPSYDPATYWRGNVWPSVNWLVYQGLRRYGYTALANELAARSFALIKQSGFWEFYHPATGQGLGGTNFSWVAVMLDMAATSAGL